MNLMSKAITFRESILYFKLYENQGNTPGIVETALKLVYQSFLFDNLYFDDALILEALDEPLAV